MHIHITCTHAQIYAYTTIYAYTYTLPITHATGMWIIERMPTYACSSDEMTCPRHTYVHAHVVYRK